MSVVDRSKVGAQMKTKYQIGVVITGLILVASCAPSPEFEACKSKGIAYFKEIEAWPRLSDGRDAETVVIERCNRTATAFG